MTSLRRPGVAAAGLASGLVAVLVATTGLASAEQYTQVDSVRDVVTASADPDTGEETLAPNPADAAADIRALRFDFRDDRLVVRAKMRESAPRTRITMQVRAAGVGYYFFSRGSGGIEVSVNDSSDERCRGGVATTRKRTATIRLVVPASCFGDPSSVRVGFAVLRYDRDDGLETVNVDDAGRTGFPKQAQRFKLSQRIRRG